MTKESILGWMNNENASVDDLWVYDNYSNEPGKQMAVCFYITAKTEDEFDLICKVACFKTAPAKIETMSGNGEWLLDNYSLSTVKTIVNYLEKMKCLK